MTGARRRILEITIAGALTVCAGLLLLSNAKDEPSRNALDRAVLRIASPFERVVSWVVSGIGDIGNRYVWLRDVDGENAELRSENEELRRQLADARRAASDTEALEELLDFKERVPARTVGARLSSGSLSPQYRLIRVRLDRGGDEVREGMPVVTGDGLVGRIETVLGNTCEVLLVTDPRSSIDVVATGSGGRGVLTGTADQTRYVAKIEQLDRGVAIRVGDAVTTSGLGGLFPAGLELGKVTAVQSDPSSLYQNVEVSPAVDFASLDRMLILLTVPPPPHSTGTDAPTELPADAPVAKRVRGL